MSLPPHLALYTAQAERADQRLADQRDLQMRKLRAAALWGAAALVIGVALSLWFYRGLATVPLFTDDGFPEWKPATEIFFAESVPAEIGFAFARLFEVGGAIIQSGSSGQIAATSRLIACLMIFIVILVSYRSLLLEHYYARGQITQYHDYKAEAHSLGNHLRRAAIALAALVAGYVAISVTWITLDLMFKEFSASYLGASAFSGLFVAVVTFAVAYWSQTVTTRHLIGLGLLTFSIGLGGSFAMAGIENGEQWWQAAVSRAGANPQADWLFIATFGSVFLIFVVLWFDVNGFVRLIVAQADLHHAAPPQDDGLRSRLHRWLRANTFGIIRALYFIAIAGLLGVGFVRFNLNDLTTVAAHTGGALSAILIFIAGGLCFAVWFPDPILGLPFKRFSQGAVGLAAASIVLFAVGILNLAGIELVCLILVGMWFFFALDTVLTYVNALPQISDTVLREMM
jgi:hypothetical protein